MKTETIHIKNMVCSNCIPFLQEKFEELNLVVHYFEIGKAKISYNEKEFELKELKELLVRYGFDILEKRNNILVQEIKVAVIELIHQLNNVNSIVRKSDYLVEKLGFSYQHLSKVFSEQEKQTLEKYIIAQKIERIKYLLDDEEYSLSEIAYMMDYSSVQYLSNQFKKITGVTVSQYKAGSEVEKKAIDKI